MNNLLSVLGVKDFENLLSAYNAAGIHLEYLIDGGAGSGGTAKVMLRSMPSAKQIWAFEPFEGNHRFFKDADSRVSLARYAMYKESTQMKFEVSTVVQTDSTWGARGLAGYSSAGRLAEKPRENIQTYDVECVRTDVFVGAGQRIDFVKLDLQGGEHDAILGMTDFLDDVQFMWVEFSGQPGLVKLLDDLGFVLFDTEYLFHDHPDDEAHENFIVTEDKIALSTGTFAWKGVPKRTWADYDQTIQGFKKTLRMVQTDFG